MRTQKNDIMFGVFQFLFQILIIGLALSPSIIGYFVWHVINPSGFYQKVIVMGLFYIVGAGIQVGTIAAGIMVSIAIWKS